MLDLFLEAAYTKTKQAELQTSMQSALESLPIDELMAITRGESSLNKTAHYGMGGDDPMCWLEHFQGSPLYEEALAIEKRQLELDMQANADQQRSQSVYNERDVLRVKRKMLELQLAEQAGGGGGDELQAEAPAGAAPAVAQTAAPAPAGEGAMNIAKAAADLTAAARAQIKPKNFALSSKQSDTGKPAYPIEDRRHAANALARVRQHGDATEKAEVYKDVARKYPEMARHSDVPEVRAKTASSLGFPSSAGHYHGGSGSIGGALGSLAMPAALAGLGYAGYHKGQNEARQGTPHKWTAGKAVGSLMFTPYGAYQVGKSIGSGKVEGEHGVVEKKADAAHIADLIHQGLQQGAGQVAKLKPSMYGHIADAPKAGAKLKDIAMHSLVGGGHPALSGGFGAKLGGVDAVKIASMRFQAAMHKLAFNPLQAAKNVGQLGMHMAAKNPTAAMGLAGAGLGAAGGAIAGGPNHRLGGALGGAAAGGALGAAGGFAAPKIRQGMQNGLGFGEAAKATGQAGMDALQAAGGNAMANMKAKFKAPGTPAVPPALTPMTAPTVR